MSIPSITSHPPCLYQFDRDRTCGGVVQYHFNGNQVTLPPSSPTPLSGSNAGDITTKSDDSVGFDDILDIVNPLQHLPLIGWAYRRITGDTIKPVPAMMGGAIYGGGIGLLSSAVRQTLINVQEQNANNLRVATLTTPTFRTESDMIPSKIDIAWNEVLPKTLPPRYESFDREQTAGSIAVYG